MRDPDPARRGLLVAGARAWTLALACAIAPACGGSRELERPPNVIVIVVDTLRADRLGAHGYPRPTSPNLDQLAREGTLYADCTSQSAWTRPSMVSLLHGRYYTAYRDAPEPGRALLAETFRAAGYRTIGATANLLLKAQYGFDRGFDVYDDRRANKEPEATMSIPRTFEQLCADLWPLLDATNGATSDAMGDATHDATNDAEIETTGKATSDATKAAAARPPLFLYLQPFDPHAPYFEHAEYEAELSPRAASVPFDAAWHSSELARSGFAASETDPTGERALRFIRYQRGLYDQEVRATDTWIGKLLDGLRARGLLEHAVVALVSDHGEGLWDHVAWLEPDTLTAQPPQSFFYQQHGAHLYEEAIRTPFVLWGAGVPRGARVAAAVENIDLYPTLLELANLPLPEGLHGRSVLPLARGETLEPRRFVYSSVLLGDCVREVASGLKLVEPSAMGRKFRALPELYDLRTDPLERADITTQPATDAQRLLDALREWRVRYPTESTFGAQKTEEELQLLRNLGYTSDHYGK
jgi:arylsulfatase A-like enzyme